MRLIATLAAAMMVAASAFAAETAKKPVLSGGTWTLNLGLALPSGDHDDAGVDTMFMVGVDYGMAGMNSGMGPNTSSYFGAMAMFGDGDADFQSRTWGVHYGFMFGLGSDQTMPLKIKLQGGLYNTRLEQGSADADEWGFGGLAGLVWSPSSGGGGMSFTIEGGYYFMPSVEGVNNNGLYFAVGIPLKT